MKLWIRVFFICLLMTHQNLHAVQVERLYEAEVIAQSGSSEDRDLAIKQALQRVLLRILAGDNILQDDMVKAVLANASDYVSEYQYSLAEAEHQNARLLRVLFNEPLLINTFRPTTKGLWNEIRPRTLVWLVVEDQNGAHFFDPDKMPEVDWALKKASRQKKIPVLMPMQDLTEKRVLSISDVLSAYSEHLLEVSVRYEVVSTLAGKIVKHGKCWKAEWTLYFDAKIQQWRSPCSSVADVTLSGLQGVYNRLSKVYAAKPESTSIDSIILKVSGIKRLKEVGQVRDYLEKLPMIKTATWLATEGNYNQYRIFYQGETSDLNNMLSVGRVLKSEGGSKQNSKEITYQFLNN